MSEDQKNIDGDGGLNGPSSGAAGAADEAAPRAPINHELGSALAKPKVLAELHVVLFVDGTFSVNGPLDNPFHFHGLLGLAGDAMRETRAKQAAEAARIDLSAAKRGPGFLRKILAGKREAQGILKKGS